MKITEEINSDIDMKEEKHLTRKSTTAIFIMLGLSI